MEELRIAKNSYKIVNINGNSPLITITFPKAVDLTSIDLSKIILLTAGGVECTTFYGYETIYKAEGNVVTLSNDGSIYIEPVTPDPVEPVIPSEEELLQNAIQSKLIEVSNVCQSIIYAGTDITTSVGTQHFSLKIEDQTNLSFAYNSILSGATEFPYHADGELCRLYSADDIRIIATEATAFKVYHTTYCNHLNIWIRRCTTREEVNAITYGAALPADLQSSFTEIVGG